jgi:hypothetical protein
MRSRCCLCIPLLNLECLTNLYKTRYVYNRTRAHLSSLLKNPPITLCRYVYPPIVARQQLCKNPFIVARQRLSKNPPIVAMQRLGRKVIAVTNTHATEELLDPSFSMWPVSYQGK